MPPAPRPVPAQIHRAEIEERTRNGESCEQIAEALRTNHGVEINFKTISRRRCEWGLRTRAKRGPNQNPNIIRKPRTPRALKPAGLTDNNERAKNVRKEEITRMTQEGMSALDIANALAAIGVKFNKGESTILRLQTKWELIPRDPLRTKLGAKGAARRRAVENGELPARRKPQPKPKPSQTERVNPNPNPETGLAVIHYPTNCNFGPGARSPTDNSSNDNDGYDTINIDSDDELGDTPMSPEDDMPFQTDDGIEAPVQPQPSHETSYPQPPPIQQQTFTPLVQQSTLSQYQPIQPRPPPLNLSAEIMSANLMVDLAISSLGAAKDLKNILLAAQFHRPATQQPAAGPATLDDVMIARRKLRAAANCFWQLAQDNVTEPGPS